MDENTNTTTNPAPAEAQPQDITITKNDGTMTASVNPTADVSAGEVPSDEKPIETQNPAPAEADAQEVPLQTEMQNHQQTEDDLKADLQTKGVDFDALAKEYDADGELSEASMKKLADAGYPKSVVNAYLAGLQAMTDRFVSEVTAMAGGEEGFKRLSAFIAQQDKSVIDAFNNSIRTNDLGQIKLAISGLMSQMKASYGTANPTIMAGQNGRGAVSGYTTTAQLTKDMADPRYQTDPAFTREVYRKISNSSIF